MTDFAKTKTLFHLPDEIIYLDGNSLGPLPKDAVSRVQSMMDDEWGKMLIGGWNHAGWMQQPSLIGDRIATLIGAESGSVIMGDTLSVKIYQALASALQLRPDRRIILSDNGNFPTDLYMAEGLIKTFDKEHELRLVDPEAIVTSIDETIAVVMLTEVDYRSGRRHDMAKITQAAHDAGALIIWDLAHSAGAVDLNLKDVNADFACGCTYKYLNGGPGAPAFIYVAPRLIDKVSPALSGWLGHEAPFAFDLDYRAGNGIERMRVGTPPVIQLAALEAAMDIWDMVNINDIRKASIHLCDFFIAEIERRCPQLTLLSPRDGTHRGSQVSFRFREGYAVIQALIARGVIGDFRAPDLIRFGITPLYIGEQELERAAEILAEIMEKQLWENPLYMKRAAVT